MRLAKGEKPEEFLSSFILKIRETSQEQAECWQFWVNNLTGKLAALLSLSRGERCPGRERQLNPH